MADVSDGRFRKRRLRQARRGPAQPLFPEGGTAPAPRVRTRSPPRKRRAPLSPGPGHTSLSVSSGHGEAALRTLDARRAASPRAQEGARRCPGAHAGPAGTAPTPRSS